MVRAVIFIWFFVFPLLLIGQSYIKIEPVSFNTPDYSDIAPAYYYKGGVFYTSNVKTTAIESKKTTENEYFYNVYYYSTDKSQKILIDSMLKKINTTFHDGPMVAYGDTFIVSQNFYIKGGKKHKAPVGIFFYDFSSNKETPVYKPFPYNNTSYRVGHPCISSDGKYLFFSSNIPGGYGGFDIYVSEKKDTTWDVPKNLGSKINSSADEITPFVISNRLYFASNRDSAKKFDIFFSENEQNQWLPAQALPEPFSSPSNDFGFICDASYEQGFFVSDRKKTDDIYRFYSTLPTFEQCDTMVEKVLCFHFIDETSQYIDTLPVIYEWDFGDSVKVQAWEADHCYNDYGTYFVRLVMIDTIADEIHEVANYTLDVERVVQPYITISDTIRVNQPVIFDSKDSYFPNGTIEQFVWIFNDGYKHVGNTCERVFKKPGKYWVRLGYVARDETKNTIKKCSILEFDVY
ncbi:MAG: PKD domain-containing protein [Bacteroidales bacterium]|nr:PKD domain-containing protein [Bacteroidales bacterium]